MEQNTDRFAPTKDLGEAYRRCDPIKPLSGEALNHWYVDCSDVRGVPDFVEHMAKPIEYLTGTDEAAAGRPFAHIIVSGHKGCGKSTELHRLEARLESANYKVVYVDVASWVIADEMDVEAIVMATIRALVEAELPGLGEKHINEARNWFAHVLQQKTDVREAEIKLTADAGLGGGSPLLKLLAAFKGYIRQATEDKRTFEVEYKRYLGELADQLNMLLARAREGVERAGHEGFVLVLDGLDRVESRDRQQEVFVDNQALFAELLSHTVFTVPISLVCSDASRQLQDAFGEPCLLPCINLEREDGAGLARARDVVLRRCDESLFEDGVIDYVCRQSGGDLRNIMRLLREAIGAAAGPRIASADAEAAFYSVGRGFANWLTADDYTALALHNRDRKRSPTDDLGRRLLMAGAILAYANHRNWFLVHPAVQVLTGFRQADAAAAGAPEEQADGT